MQGAVLSAAATQAATAAAAAAGLTFVRELPMECWVLLQRADGKTDSAGTAAAIQVLKGSNDEVMTAATSNGPVFQYATPDVLIPRPHPQQPRTPTTTTPSNSSAEVLASSRSAGPAQQTPGLPDECGSGSCTADGAWGLNRIKAVDLWRLLAAQRVMPLSKSSFTLKGTVVDDGLDFLHNNVKGQADVTNSATFKLGQNHQPAGGIAAVNFTHGTHVFGIMAANWSPYDSQSDASGLAGVVGPAYGNLASINVFGNEEGAALNDIFEAVGHAVKANTHHVINLSSGAPGNRAEDRDALYRDVYEPICRAGAVIIVAAGDSVDYKDGTRGRDIADVYAPSLDPLTWFSCYGQGVRIAAPGEQILSSVQSTPDNRWKTDKWDGTSMAAPYVAGAALLLRNLFPAATAKQVVTCLVTSADRTVTSAEAGTGRTINGGVLNVLAAYNCLAAAALDCSAVQLPVPACVERAAGKEDKSCKASASVYCLAITGHVANSMCSYPLRAAGSTCDIGDQVGTCNGMFTDCVPLPTQCMGTPVLLNDAVWSWDTCLALEAGKSCNATCWAAFYFYGPGYTATCQADGTFSKPVGQCTKRKKCMKPPANPVDAQWDFATCIGLEPGKSCNATCFALLSYFGPGYTATCQADGTFSKPVGQCTKRKKCTVPLRDSIDAQWNPSCRGLEPGNSCNATCWAAFDYYGAGYTTTCQADGTWSTPVGSCTKAQPRVTCYKDCKAANCDAKSGCKCDLVQGAKGVDWACTCNAQLGMMEYSWTDAKQWSSCIWNLTFPKGARLQARRNANLTLEVHIMSGASNICPPRGVNLITGIRFGKMEACPADALSSYAELLSAGKRVLNSQLCTPYLSQGNTALYYFNVRPPAGRANLSCTKMYVGTSDGFETELLLRLTA
uniref:Sushi domain-containing protein n=1 Tax=Tetradesmus obliquus TaxID=3088 RepID=A0A383V8P5_TETOB|eukprot:jgi/Sobl393_1/3626/SZX61938.1